MDLTTQYSWWYIILCAILAGLYTFFLYFKNKQTQELKSWVVQLLTSLRFISVFTIAILLLNLFVKTWLTHAEPPVIIIAQDNSASITNNQDSVYYKTTYLEQLTELEQNLASEYKVVSLAFGDDVSKQDSSYSFTEKRTNFTQVFDEIESRYAGDNIAAVVFASDGLNNAGVNPNYYTFKQNYPVFTIGMGDTTLRSDIAIADIRINDIVYAGNSFPIEVSITADLLAGNTATLDVYHQGKKIESREIEITKQNQLTVERFVFESNKEGTQRYTFKVTQFADELNPINNNQQALIDVVGNSDKVLILAAAPHPDIAALKGVLLEKENYHVQVATAEGFTENIEEYNLIIAHGFPNPKFGSIFNSIWNSKIPLLSILPGNTNLRLVEQLNLGFTIDTKSRKVNQILPVLNSDFKAFQLSKETQSFLTKVPPLSTPFAEISGFKEPQAFLYQKLGMVETTFPLMYFDKMNDRKTAWLFGDGVWQWKFIDFRENGTHEHFNEIVWKIVQYLSVKEDKSRFRVKVPKRFNENEDVIFNAQFYNKSYEQVPDLEVKLELKNEEGKSFNYVFAPAQKSYRLDMGRLPAGVYSYEAIVNNGVNNFIKKGSFIVVPINIEWTKVSADFSVLQKLSERTNGKFFLPSQMNDLATVFDDKSKFPTYTYRSEKKQEVIHYKWIFFLILSLLTLEWGVRKYVGRY